MTPISRIETLKSAGEGECVATVVFFGVLTDVGFLVGVVGVTVVAWVALVTVITAEPSASALLASEPSACDPVPGLNKIVTGVSILEPEFK